MLYQISDGTFSRQGKCILSHVDFEIHGKEKIAIVGRNGAGKTTLLRLLAGELELDRDDKRQGAGIAASRKLTVEMLRQETFESLERSVEEELRPDVPEEEQYEYDALFTGFGFDKEDKKRRLSEFSGGERTKIALIRLLLKKPDLLLLDEPTNHLDVQTVEWLERYLRTYDRAVVMVSHDRFFIDETVDVVYELENGKLTRYPGNYTNYRVHKAKNRQIQQKAYERYIEEKERLEALIERFKHKPNKAAFARAKRKTLERLPKVEKPADDGPGIFVGEIVPEIPGSKRVLECERLQIGYDEALLEVTIRIRKGQKIAILGDNGVGKSTFLKTVAGLMEPLKGKLVLGNNTVIGYFDQHSAEMESDQRVLEHFCGLFPSLQEKEARRLLGMYLFDGNDAGKKVRDLSGGEKVRLVLAELLNIKPNFLLLDEPTNHCDIRAKERLEQIFKAYKGTLLFISHDRYFVQELADAVLIFEGKDVFFYPFGYRHYLEQKAKMSDGNAPAARRSAEEQALIDGLKAVPKAERHRLKEVSPEELYEDWKMGPVRERLEEAEAKYVQEIRRSGERMLQWEASGEFWDASAVLDTDVLHAGQYKLEKPCRESREAWHQACLEWYDSWLEMEESFTD